MSGRLPPGSGELIKRGRIINFQFDGRTVEGLEGDTIASALHADGHRVLSRSFKYHRPRGLLCCAGSCPNCLVEVDGWPGVRACTEPARPGMRVRHLNAQPSLKFDLMRGVDYVGGRLTPPGFYYKTFIRPRRLWPLYEKVLRRAAGLGKLPKRQPERGWRTEYRRRHADVLVIGGGIAGLNAALAAAEPGADVVLVDDGPTLGGQLLVESPGKVEELAEKVRLAGVEVLSPASALGYFDSLVPVWAGSTLHQIRAAGFVAATGSVEQPLMLENNDLPGVMLCSGAERLAALYGVRPGNTAVVAATNDGGLESALRLHRAGVAVAAVADAREAPSAAHLAALEAEQIEVIPATTATRALGRNQVTGVVLRRTGEAGAGSGERRIDCDLLAVSGGWAPSSSLLLQAGAEARWDEERQAFLPRERRPANVHPAGAVIGDSTGSAAERSGRLAGAAAARSAGIGAGADGGELELDRKAPLRGRSKEVPGRGRSPSTGGKRCFACLCEDVTTKDITSSMDEGFDSLELLKRYTTATMGPCQGRMCQMASVRTAAEHTGTSMADVGLTTARPPWASVPMGILAGRPFEPAKRSAVHGRHRALGGNIMWAGDWRRPYDYGDPHGEAMAVHDRAGLIDISTLGKLIVRGPDAGRFLNLLYPSRFDNLRPGRIRYGVLDDDAGRILDDGTICRLDEQTYYVTTTSSGADAVEAWFAWWLSEWDLDVHLTDVSQGVSAFNLAGPLSREILAGVTDLDCSNDSFGYLDGRQAQVAGVPALLLRIGFVGELGYELHCPAPMAEHLWDALTDAGEPQGIKPFGLEPQRVLRLQKMHILVGQDTDAESNPLEAAMPWIVKLDKKEDFIGRWALESVQERGVLNRLIGFTIQDGVVPAEGAAVVGDGDLPVGRVTSSRFSPKLGKTIGIAWVPASLAGDGSEITLADKGRRLTARVQTAPFYDPDQERLRA